MFVLHCVMSFGVAGALCSEPRSQRSYVAQRGRASPFRIRITIWSPHLQKSCTFCQILHDLPHLVLCPKWSCDSQFTTLYSRKIIIAIRGQSGPCREIIIPTLIPIVGLLLQFGEQPWFKFLTHSVLSFEERRGRLIHFLLPV